MSYLVICFATSLLFRVCSGAQKHPTTITTTPNALTPTTQPIPITQVIQEIPTAPSPQVCADATSTTTPLGKLRSAMRNASYTRMNAYFDAFIIFYSDEHLSEDPSPEERRLQYISGWDGVGTGVVLAEAEAAIWVPSNDVRRARAMLTCAWLVLDADDLTVPSIADWIIQGRTRPGRVVGGDARLTSVNEWASLSANLQREGMQLFHAPGLVDSLWDEELNPMRKRPEFSRIVANLHHPEYIGVTWREKVWAVRNELRLIGADAMVVTALDEVAWLLNIRGRDLPYAPLLKAFIVISTKEFRVYAPAGKLSMPVREALSAYNCFSSASNPAHNCTKVNDYATIYADLRRPTESKILIPTPGTFQKGASAAIGLSIPQAKKLLLPSPLVYLKAQKNSAEIKGMNRAHLRDAVAMCTVLSYMESKGAAGSLNEQTVSVKVDATRATQAGYVGLSMQTLVAFGPNAAEPEYRVTNFTNRRIFSNSTLVIQSGGQYDEGTTVVTRTVHYGKAKDEERKAYTSVLRSLAALSMLQTPTTLPAAHTDPVARAPLWNFKQDYYQPTGYGVGAALSRREDPVVIDYRQDTNLHTFRDGYFITIEPAWYQPNKFGVKLGNVLEVIQHSGGYLGFREATLIPFEPKLIDRNLLTEYEIKWLNSYNERIRQTVGPELRDQGLTNVYYWMMNKTINIESPRARKQTTNSAVTYKLQLNIYTYIIPLILSYL